MKRTSGVIRDHALLVEPELSFKTRFPNQNSFLWALKMGSVSEPLTFQIPLGTWRGCKCIYDITRTEEPVMQVSGCSNRKNWKPECLYDY